jgi:hypothetical protein
MFRHREGRHAMSQIAETVEMQGAVPIVRVLEAGKAKDFYLGRLGFSLDWEHRFEDGFPLYAQVSRSGLTLHLSEHTGDAAPGCNVYVRVRGLEALQREFAAQGCDAPIEDGPGHTRVLQLSDPFGNRLRFAERPAVAPNG